MSAWVIFRRARSLFFAFLVLGFLTWATLFAVFLYHEWSHFSRFQKIVVAGLASLYVSTAVLLYLMAVVLFRFWWEVARILALLVVHTGGSVLFMRYSPRLPCRGFGAESTCRKFVHTIMVGCWVFSGLFLFFAMALGIMAFFPQPAKSLPESEENEKAPLSPASFGAGSPTDEWRQISSFYSIDSRTGLVTYKDGAVPQDASSLLSDRDTNPADGAHQETITVRPPHLSVSFRNSELRLSHESSTHDGTLSTRDISGDRASAVSRPQRVESFQSNPFRDPTSPPASIHSLASTSRTGVGGETSYISEDRLIRSPTFPEPIHRALSPIALHDSPSLMTTRRDGAAEYTPVLSTILSHYSFPASSGSSAQPEQTHPVRAQAATRSARSVHSLAASVHSKWAASTPHVPPPPALTPGAALFRGHSVSLGPRDPSSAYNASFRTWGSKPGLVRQVSEPIQLLRRFGENQARSSHPRVKESPFPRRKSDGQVLDRTQWQQLVLSAAAKQ